MAEYLLGIDAGTESIRTGVFDLKGHKIIWGSKIYRIYR